MAGGDDIRPFNKKHFCAVNRGNSAGQLSGIQFMRDFFQKSKNEFFVSGSGDQEVEAAPAAGQVAEGSRQEPGGDQQLARAVGQGRAELFVLAEFR
jgi:hypothetical protein